MSYYPEPDSLIRDKVKVLLNLSNYATKKELEHATGIDTSYLAAKKDFIALKAEVDKLDINKLTNVPTSLNNLKRKVDIYVGKLETIPADLKKLSDVVDNEVVKNTKFNTLKKKVNNLDNKKNPNATTLIYISLYNRDKQNLVEKIGVVDKKNTRHEWCSDYNCFKYKISEAENKIPNTSNVVTITVS